MRRRLMYKIIYNDKIVDVLETVRWIRFLRKFDDVVMTDKTSADGFYGSDNKTIYVKEGGYRPLNKMYRYAKLEYITEIEYNNLKHNLLQYNQVEANKSKLDQIKWLKITEMSKECNKAIVKGISVKLSDGLSHRFSLTTEDQLNIRSLQLQNLNEVVYHEDGKACKKYSNEDFNLIAVTAQNRINYQTTYFNFLKQYIKSLSTIDDINKVYYGLDLLNTYLPDEYKDILKEMQNV